MLSVIFKPEYPATDILLHSTDTPSRSFHNFPQPALDDGQHPEGARHGGAESACIEFHDA